ncbi:MAG: glycosyltransferase [Deltaproteobacteria bacterium]|nr:glycosyltransferase [Deltaproteobacteria bacterium]
MNPAPKLARAAEPLVSCAMLVKNGGPLFVRALASVRDYVDEIVVVDTNERPDSPDAAAARAAGARVRHRPWRRHFSRHRNQSLKACRGAWVLVLDADEEFAPAPDCGPAAWRRLLAEQPPAADALALALDDVQAGQVVMTMHTARVFRRGRAAFRGRVHNQAVFPGRLVSLGREVVLRHFGYDQAQVDLAAKYQRTKGLLEQDLLQEPAQNPRRWQAHFYLAQLHLAHGHLAAGLAAGEKYLALAAELGPEFNPTIYFSLVEGYLAAGNPERAGEMLRQGLAHNPQDPDLAWALSNEGVRRRDPGLIAEGARRYLAAYQRWQADPASLGGAFHFSLREEVATLLLHRLALASLAEGRAALGALLPRLAGQPALAPGLREQLRKLGLGDLAAQVPVMPGDIASPALAGAAM